MNNHWSVSVFRNGENVVTIESNCLSGRNLSAEDEATVRDCARHLLAFVGDGSWACVLCSEAAGTLSNPKRHVLHRRDEICPRANGVVHGKTCEKRPHDAAHGGYLHSEDDDSPYDVDGVRYCGRCHRCLVAP